MRKRTKILHVVHSLEVGGLENGVVNLLNRMDAGRFSHIVCCLTKGGKFADRIQASDVELIELQLPRSQFRFPLVRLAKLFRGIAPDVMHSRGWSAIDAAFAARLSGVPFIVHAEHGREHSDIDGANWKRNQIRRVAGRLVDRYVIVCDFFRPWLRKSCGVDERKIVHIPNGVDTEKFFPLLSDQRSWPALRCLRQSAGLPAEGVLVGSVGRLDPVKDFPTLLKGFAELKIRLPAATLVVVGDGPIRSDLTRMAHDLGLDSAVIWLGARTDIPALMRCFDIFVQTSIVEGMSNTILEAMATGLPIVATSTGGNPELVRNDSNGILVPVGDIQRLAEALERYVVNAALRKAHGSSSRHRALSEFDLSVMVSRYSELYELGAARATRHRAHRKFRTSKFNLG